MDKSIYCSIQFDAYYFNNNYYANMTWCYGAVQWRKSMFKHRWHNIGEKCVARSEALHIVRGFGGMPPPHNFFIMVRFCAVWCIFRSNFVYKKFQKLPLLYKNFQNYNLYMKINKFTIFLVKIKKRLFFYIKIKYFRYTLAMG